MNNNKSNGHLNYYICNLGQTNSFGKLSMLELKIRCKSLFSSSLKINCQVLRRFHHLKNKNDSVENNREIRDIVN